MMFNRIIKDKIIKTLTEAGKGVILYGPRQAGKTVLVKSILADLKLNSLELNADIYSDWWAVLTSRELPKIKALLSGYDILFVDEAQRIPEIGIILKIILDNVSDLKVIATGSSALDLASRISEPLTGRVYSYKLFPISVSELMLANTRYETHNQLEERLVFGSYPVVFSKDSFEERELYLKNLVDSYLYKDLLEFSGIKNSFKIRDLLKLLAFQMGSEVSVLELANSLEVSRDTINNYIDLLEKSFVIFRLSGFNRNLRKEVSKMHKVYFYDNGVRNTLIGNFNVLKNRGDVGQLWENFLISERMKKMEYNQELYSHYFWRLTSGAEIDLVEERDGKLSGFEFKYSVKTAKSPKSWTTAYPGSSFTTINKDNYLDFAS